MKNKPNQIQLITNAAVLAALVVTARYVQKMFFAWGTPAASFLGIFKDLELFIIPITTIYFVNKFGKMTGFLTAIIGIFVAVITAWALGVITPKTIWSTLPFGFMIPWMAPTLVAFATSGPKEQDTKITKVLLISLLINIIIILSWAFAVIFDYNYTFKAGIVWHLVTYHGWTFFISMSVITMIMNKRFKKISIK